MMTLVPGEVWVVDLDVVVYVVQPRSDLDATYGELPGTFWDVIVLASPDADGVGRYEWMGVRGLESLARRML